MTTPDEIARQIMRAAQSGDGDANVMAYAEVLLRRWREEIRQEEITTCARVWGEVELKKQNSDLKKSKESLLADK